MTVNGGYDSGRNEVLPAQSELPGSVTDDLFGGVDVAQRTDTGPFSLTPAWVLLSGVSARAVHLYGLLALHADREGRSWPSRKKLCAELNVSSVNTFLTALKELEDAEAVTVVARFAAYGQTTNGYFIHRAHPDNRQSAGPPRAVDGASPRAVSRAQNQTHFEPDPLTGEHAVNGDSPNAVQLLVAGYVADYQATHHDESPFRSWRGAAGTAAKKLLKDGVEVDVLASCLGVCAAEGKNPSTLANVVDDWRADRPRKVRR